MSEVGTAVPANVNLAKHKPYAVSAYSRRVKSIANNAQSFGPDSYVNITLDTSTPGSFLDPLSSYLKFDINITNTNVFADYISFGNAGAASVIEEFRIYVQGTPIEEILQYNLFYELAMSQNGQTQQPFHIFKPNPSQLTVSNLFHLNAIKAPMVDMDGRPMWGDVKSSLSARSRSVAWAYAQDEDFTTVKMIGSQATASFQANFGMLNPLTNFANTADRRNILIADAHSLLFGQSAPTSNLGTRNLTVTGDYASGAEYAGLFPAIYSGETFKATQTQSVTMANVESSSVGMDAYNSVVTYTGGKVAVYGSYLTTADGILPYSGTTVEFPSLFGETRAEVYNPDFDAKNPLNWCSFLPATELRPEMKALGPDNLQDYMMFLSNTKYIPIGMPGYSKEVETSFSVSGIPAGFTATATSNNFKNIKPYSGTAVGNEIKYTYTCCIPLISGVLGSFADKCWPTMLIAPGSMYIQIRTATPQKAFQLSMDPCRRVLGTIRDYVPYGGTMGGLFGQLGAPQTGATDTASVGNAGNSSVSFYADSDSNSSSRLWGCLPGDTETAYKAVAAFENTANVSSVQRSDITCATKSNGYCCIGTSLASASKGITQDYLTPAPTGEGVLASNTSTGVGLMFRPYSVAALEGRWTIGRAYVLQNNFNKFTYPAAYPANQVQFVPVYTTEIESSVIREDTNGNNIGSTLMPTPITSNYINEAGWGTAAQSVGVSTEGTTQDICSSVNVKFSPSGIPLPQYWLSATPWLKKNLQCKLPPAVNNVGSKYEFWGSQHIDVANEGTACYGTFLLASVPQSRRVLTHVQNPTTELVTYSLSNIEFVSQQIILPDSVSASILQQAASGDISITSNSIHNYQTPIAVSDNQNLIIPAKIASANTMYCLFVPQAFVSGSGAYAYNSLRGINPFAAVAATNASGVMNSNGFTNIYNPAIGLGYEAGQVHIRNTPAGNGAFQIQLKIGNELIPQQPLTSVTELVTENVKAQHKLFDTSSNVNVTYGLTNTRSQFLGGQFQSGLSFDALQPGSFCTTFLSAEMLDDQTAINNPTCAHIYAAENTYRYAFNQSTKEISDYVIKRNPYCLELFQPPESSFVIAFDMDTWSRYNEVTRSGKFLGNNTITLSLTGAIELGLPNAVTGSNGFVLQTFVVHDIRFSFQAGGSVVSYY
jgi:hypothetical protein